MMTELQEAYGFLFERELLEEIAECGSIRKINAGKRIFFDVQAQPRACSSKDRVPPHQPLDIR